jgi:hypothetical protein
MILTYLVPLCVHRKSEQLAVELNFELTNSNLTNKSDRLSSNEVVPLTTERNIQLSFTACY